MAGDWDFWVRLLVRSKVAFVATPLNDFRKSWQDGSCQCRSAKPHDSRVAKVAGWAIKTLDVPAEQAKRARYYLAGRWRDWLREDWRRFSLLLTPGFVRTICRADPLLVYRIARVYLWVFRVALRSAFGVRPGRSDNGRNLLATGLRSRWIRSERRFISVCSWAVESPERAEHFRSPGSVGIAPLVAMADQAVAAKALISYPLSDHWRTGELADVWQSLFSLYWAWSELPMLTVVSDGSWSEADFGRFSWWPGEIRC